MQISKKLFRFLSLYLLVSSLVTFADQRTNSNRGYGRRPGGNQRLHIQLRRLLRQHDASAIDGPDEIPEAMFELGQALFFDPILSGNRDIACATCHHPSLATGDSLSLPVGTGTATPGSIGIFRELGRGRTFIPRNAPEIFNRGNEQWTTQFWDSRIKKERDGFLNPAGEDLPGGFDHVLQVQAMFPVTSRDEMRGDVDDDNELAEIRDDDLPAIWNALMRRLLRIPGYEELFIAAFNLDEFGEEFIDFGLSELGFQDAAVAIAAFEQAAYTFTDSPFDSYLRGNRNALTREQLEGAILFYGEAKCATCHSGQLMTDQEHHHLGVPAIGPGKDEDGNDFGLQAISGRERDKFRFRTPPLRNVTETGPWMHNGAFTSLREAIELHFNPRDTLRNFELGGVLGRTVVTDFIRIRDLDTRRTYRNFLPRFRLNRAEVNKILAFLEALRTPDLISRLEDTIPNAVPSGLDIDMLPDI